MFGFIKEVTKFFLLLPLAMVMLALSTFIIMPGILFLGGFIILLLATYPGF